MQCPNCKFETDSPTECPKCGIVFEKFARHHSEHAPAAPPAKSILNTPIGRYSLKSIIAMSVAALVFGNYLPSRNHSGLILEWLGDAITRAVDSATETPRENRAAALPHDENGFVEMPKTDLARDTVYVLAAEGCPKADAQRADRLYTDLANRKIPSVRAHSVNFFFSNSSQVDTTKAVMEGRLPVVFVKGRAKNNPTVAEVMAEYQH